MEHYTDYTGKYEYDVIITDKYADADMRRACRIVWNVRADNAGEAVKAAKQWLSNLTIAEVQGEMFPSRDPESFGFCGTWADVLVSVLDYNFRAIKY